MTGLLLDTHALLWRYADPGRLPNDVLARLCNRDEQIWVSAVSAYEIALKNKIGKLPGVEPLLESFALVLVENGFRQLPVSVRHALTAGRFELHIRDPFDRLLVAQAVVDDLTIVSRERPFDQFGVDRFW